MCPPDVAELCYNTPFLILFVHFKEGVGKAGLPGGHFALGKEQIKLRPTKLTGEYTLQQTSDLGKGHWQPLVYGAGYQ